jgi:polyphosphate kinase 2 (PPK2 family)
MLSFWEQYYTQNYNQFKINKLNSAPWQILQKEGK